MLFISFITITDLEQIPMTNSVTFKKCFSLIYLLFHDVDVFPGIKIFKSFDCLKPVLNNSALDVARYFIQIFPDALAC